MGTQSQDPKQQSQSSWNQSPQNPRSAGNRQNAGGSGNFGQPGSDENRHAESGSDESNLNDEDREDTREHSPGQRSMANPGNR